MTEYLSDAEVMGAPQQPQGQAAPQVKAAMATLFDPPQQQPQRPVYFSDADVMAGTTTPGPFGAPMPAGFPRAVKNIAGAVGDAVVAPWRNPATGELPPSSAYLGPVIGSAVDGDLGVLDPKSEEWLRNLDRSFQEKTSIPLGAQTLTHMISTPIDAAKRIFQSGMGALEAGAGQTYEEVSGDKGSAQPAGEQIMTLLGVALGPEMGGGPTHFTEGARLGLSTIRNAATNWLARKRAVDPATVSVETMTAAEKSEFAQSEDFKRAAAAQGDAYDAASEAAKAKFEETLQRRRAAEADPILRMRQAQEAPTRTALSAEGPLASGSTVEREHTKLPSDFFKTRAAAATRAGEIAKPYVDPAHAGYQQEAEITQLRREIEGVDEGRIAPGAANLPRAREPIQLPGTPPSTEGIHPALAAGIEQAAREPKPIVPETYAADTEPGLEEGVPLREKFHAPAVVEPQPGPPLTPEEVAYQQRAAGMQGRGPGRWKYQGKGKKRRRVWVPEAPGESRYFAEQGPEPKPGEEPVPPRRAAMSEAALESQDQASGAFKLKRRMEQRAAQAGKQPYVDVRAGGRPRGPMATPVWMDQNFPVMVNRVRYEDVGGEQVEIANVRRYDPRTGQPEPGSVPYDIPLKHLKTADYAHEQPRMAQEVQEARRGPVSNKGETRGQEVPPERPREPHEGVRREQRQTYRQTRPDTAENEFPGSSSGGERGGPGRGPHEGRPPYPRQPYGPRQNFRPRREQMRVDEILREFEARQRERARAEAEARRQAEREARARAEQEARARRGQERQNEQQRRQQERQRQQQGGQQQRQQQQRDPGQEARDRARRQYENSGARYSNTPKDPVNGRYPVDEHGFVMSTAGGPMKFGDQKQAARWIVGVGNKNSLDQIFEIENHPSGNGFAVRVRGHSEQAPPPPPPPPEEPAPEQPKAQAEQPKAEPPPQEPPPEPPPQEPPKAEQPKAEAPPEEPPKAEPGPKAADAAPPPEEEPAPGTHSPEEPAPEPPPQEPPKAKARKAKAEKPQAEPEPDVPPDHRVYEVFRDRQDFNAYGRTQTKTEKLGEVHARSDADARMKARQKWGDAGTLRTELKKGQTPPPEPPPIPEAQGVGFHAVQDVDKATAADVLAAGGKGTSYQPKHVRAGDYQGTGEFILRKGVDPEYDGSFGKAETKKGAREQTPESVRALLADVKEGVSDFEPEIAYDPSLRQQYHRNAQGGVEEYSPSGPATVVGKIGDQRVGIDARYYDYVVNDLGHDLRGKLSGEGDKQRVVFGIYDGDKVVGAVAGKKLNPEQLNELERAIEEAGPPMSRDEARAYREQKRPGAGYGGERTGGAKPYRATPGVKKAAGELQERFVGRLQEHKARVAAEAETRAEAETAHRKAAGEWNKEQHEAARLQSSRDKITPEQYSEYMNTFERAAKGENLSTRATETMQKAHAAGRAWAKDHPAPVLDKFEEGTINETLTTARGRKTKFSIRANEQALDNVIKKVSGRANMPIFYSGLDPALVKWLVDDVMAGSGKAIRYLGKAGRDLAGKLNPMGSRALDKGRHLYAAGGTELNMLADRYPESKALRTFTDLHTTDPGSGRHVPQVFAEAVEQRANKGAKEIERGLRMAYGDRPTTEQLEQMDQITSGSYRGPALPPEVRRGAAMIRRFYDKTHAEHAKVGIELPYVKGNYRPRILNRDAVRKDPKGAIKAFANEYRLLGMPEKDALTAAHNLERANVFDEGAEFGSQQFGSRYMKGRKFTAGADARLAPYLMKDPMEYGARYAYNSAKRIEDARRFGHDNSKFEELRAQIMKDGVTPAEIERIDELSDFMRDRVPRGGRSSTNSINSVIQAAMTPLLLSRVVWSSAMEAIYAGAQSGESTVAMSNWVKQYEGLARTEKYQAAQETAEDMGIIARGLINQTMHNRWGMQDLSPFWQRRTRQFYQSTQIERLTNMQRVVTYMTGNRVFDRMAKAAMKGDASAKEFLTELGIPERQIKGVSDLIDAAKGDLPIYSQVEAAGPAGAAYEQAMKRYVDQTIQNPKAYDRPLATARNSPIRALYGLQSFNYANYRNVTRAMARRTARNIGQGKVRRGAQHLAAATTIAGLALTYGILRDYLFMPGYSEKTTEDKALLAASRANLLGPMDVFVNGLYGGLKYDRSAAEFAVGPYMGVALAALDSVKDLWSSRNSPNTNTAERKAAGSLFSAVAVSLINYAISAVPYGSGMGGGIVQALKMLGLWGVSMPQTRGIATDVIAGEKESAPGSNKLFGGSADKLFGGSSDKLFGGSSGKLF